MVLRIHAQPRGVCLGGLPAGRDRHGSRRIDPWTRVRRWVSSNHLATLRLSGVRGRAAQVPADTVADRAAPPDHVRAVALAQLHAAAAPAGALEQREEHEGRKQRRRFERRRRIEWRRHDHRQHRPAADDDDDDVAMLRPADAIQLIIEHARRLETEEAVLAPTLAGRVLAEDVAAAVRLPPFATSAMDGYAVRAGDLGDGPVPIAFRLAAGDPPQPLPAGAAAGIATGAPMPPGGDAVVPVEDAEEVGGSLQAAAPQVGAHIRRAGGDVEEGDIIARAGRTLTPALLAAIAAVGTERVRVARRPRLAV